MTNNMMPIGSVVKVKSMDLLVVGITLEKDGNSFVKNYIVVPYPAGFTGNDSLRVINIEETEPVFNGYSSDLSKAFLKYINGLEESSKKFGANRVLEELNKFNSLSTEEDKKTSNDNIDSGNRSDTDVHVNHNSEELYPLGTVVTLLDKPYEVMIIGYYAKSEDNRYHTYLGINASHGLSIQNDSVLFDAGTIQNVIITGYENTKYSDFRNRLLKMVQETPEILLNDMNTNG